MDIASGEERRAVFLARLGIAPERLYSCEQSHSRMVAAAQGPEHLLAADGLAAPGGAALSVTVADCLPVYIYDTRRRIFALCHSGWKGTGIAGRALQLMNQRWGTRPEDCAALLGPCIRGEHYEVGEERAAVYEAEFGRLGGSYPLGTVVHTEHSGGAARWFLDMQAANAALLECAGLRSLTVCENSTLRDERLGSLRREGAAFTKMMAVIFRP